MKLARLSFFAVAALGAGAFAFAGCSVTTGTVDDNGGNGSNLDSGTQPTEDGGSEVDAGDDDASTALCTDNQQVNKPIVSDTCQACLDQGCCTQLTGCFNIAVSEDAGVTPLNCDGYAECVAQCASESDPTACYEECDLATTQEIITAYDALVTCGASTCAADCGGS